MSTTGDTDCRNFAALLREEWTATPHRHGHHYSKGIDHDMTVHEETSKIVRVTQRGQATISKEWREQLGIDAPGEVVMIAVDDSIVVKLLRAIDDLAGRHGGAFGTGEAMAKVERWREEESNHERADERIHGLDADPSSDTATNPDSDTDADS